MKTLIASSMVLFAVATFVACSSSSSPPSGATGGATGAIGTAGATTGTGGTAVASGGAAAGSGGTAVSAGGTNNSAAGTGGAAAASCSPDQPTCDGAAALTTKVVADFESGTGWFLFAPPDPGATSMPTAGANLPISQITCPQTGRCGTSLFAMHLSGSGYTSYGPSLSNEFVYEGDGGPVGMPEDASAYTGLMYWARRGDTANASPTLRVIVNDVTTDGSGGVCDVTAATGSAAMPSKACWDGWMAEKAIPSVWTLVKLPFSVLKQGGFGLSEPAFQSDKVYGITFQMPNMATYEFWIDDIAFYK